MAKTVIIRKQSGVAAIAHAALAPHRVQVLGTTPDQPQQLILPQTMRENRMSKFQKKSTVRNIVSGHEGYVQGICDVEGDRTQYLHLHIDGDGNSQKTWVPENELVAMPPGDLPPFPNPYATVENRAED